MGHVLDDYISDVMVCPVQYPYKLMYTNRLAKCSTQEKQKKESFRSPGLARHFASVIPGFVVVVAPVTRSRNKQTPLESNICCTVENSKQSVDVTYI